MSDKVCRLFLMALSIGMLATGVAHADADEASLHVQSYGGVARVGDALAPGKTASAPVAGIGARATYATHDWFAWELLVGFDRFLGTLEYRLEPGTIDGSQPESDDLRIGRSMAITRLDAGATARLGVEWIPTLHASLGLQVRTSEGWIEEDGVVRGLGWDVVFDPVATVGVGLDYRFDKTWVIGVGLLWRESIRLDEPRYRTVGGMVHLSGYWYPWQDVE